MPRQTSHRLPATVRPETYAIQLKPDLERFTFTGEESIRVRVEKPVRSIELNASHLEVAHAAIRGRSGGERPADSIQLLPEEQRVRLSWTKPVPKGPATLRLVFSGTLNDELAGFYRSKFAMADGTTGHMAATQFESTDARRAFPCWDEPAVKATFDVSLVVPAGMAAVSNMPIAQETDLGDGTRLVRFETTPRMATYLVAFVVGPLQALESRAKTGTKVGVWTLPDRVAHGRWALDDAVRVLDYLNEYYGVPFPLPKLDHISLQDFSAGAMENWGAITYRERILVMDPATSAAVTRQRITDVIAHETSHMWFGDLVTMAWWDDLWLNESFATWMGTKTTAALHPDWRMWTQFLVDDTSHGLALDGLKSSHPIEVPVHDPAEIREIFDDISYSKGASVLRMMEQFLGEEKFRRGIRSYLKAHRYGNTRTEDLWRALGAAARQPVSAVVGTWTRQMGFPVLDVKVTRKGGDARIGLTQSRFLQTHILGARDGTRWKIPVRIARAGSPKVENLLMSAKTASRPLGRSRRTPDRDWIKVNAGQSGFYRVNYPPEEWERLRRAIEAGELGAEDRIGLESDAHDLMRAGYLPATEFLELTQAYRGEDTAPGWQMIAESLMDLEDLVAQEPYLDALDAFGRSLFRDAADRTGWDPKPGEGHLDSLRRSIVLARLGHFGDPATLDEASARFHRFLEDPSSLHPDIRGVVYNLVAQRADPATYETLWGLERKATLQEEQVRLLVALGRPRDPGLLRETLRRSLTDDVRLQDSGLVILNVASARPSLGRPLAWTFVKENWDELYRRYAESGTMIRHLVEISQGFSTLEMAKDVERFFRSRKAPEVKRTVQQSLEKIRVNAAWRKRNGKELSRWFAAREP